MDFDSTEFNRYIVPEADKVNTYKRKAKVKYKKSLIKFSRETKSFDKSEGILKQWLKENIHRFNTKPIAKSNGAYYFEGVIKNVHLEISWLPESMVFFDTQESRDKYDDNFDHHVIVI